MIVSDTIRLFDEEDFSEDYPTSKVLEAVAYTFGIDPVRLRAIAEAERDGRLVIRAFKNKQTVFMISAGMVYECEMDYIDEEGLAISVAKFYGIPCAMSVVDELDKGKIIFETRESAEAALRAQEQNDPPTCEGCGYLPNQHDGRGCLNKNCWDCARLNNRSDRYKPKGADK